MKKYILAGVIILLVISWAMAAKNYTVYIKNSKVTSNAIEIKGSVYVPVKDLANALSLKVNIDKKSKTIRLISAQPVKNENIQIAAVEGPVNSWISNGITKLIADNVERTQTYDIYEPPDEGGEFVIFSIKQQNITNDTKNVGIDIDKSYIEDSKGKTYPPYLWRNEKANAIAPDASISGEIIFTVQKDLPIRVLVLKMIGADEKSIRVKI